MLRGSTNEIKLKDETLCGENYRKINNAFLIYRTAKLNGKLLKLLEDYRLPDFNAVEVNQPFSVPPLTYGFFVIPNAKAKACLTDSIFI